MLVDPELSPCVGALPTAADSEAAGLLAEEPASARLLFDAGAGCEGSVWQDPALRHMCAHAEYLSVFSRAQHFMMRGDGPLPFDVRHYIAIMAAGTHQCQEVLDQLEEEFLASGGEPRWLEGLHEAPKKLRDLDEVNRVLAHKPWMLDKGSIERLARGRDTWSLGELLQALTILAHYHAVCTFVQGCRVFSDASAGSRSRASGSTTPSGAKDNSSCAVSSPGGVPVDQLMQKMIVLSQQQSSGAESTDAERCASYDRVECEAGRRLADSDEPPPPPPPPAGGGDGAGEPDELTRRTDAGGSATFRVQDYSWDDHGFSLVNRLYSDVGVLLDDKFRTAYHLTYQTMGSFRAVDTRLFRRAVWRYIQCLYGIRHDDYDYSLINQLLDGGLKRFVRTACLTPEALDRDGLKHVMHGFQRSEKVHVAILCLEARLQSELLYALRAVMRYTT